MGRAGLVAGLVFVGCAASPQYTDVAPPPQSIADNYPQLKPAKPGKGEHAIIVTRRPDEERFIPNAAALAQERGWTPIVFSELVEMLDPPEREIARTCKDLPCFAKIGAGLLVARVIFIRPNKQGQRAIISIYDQRRGTREKQQLVSRQSAVEALKSDIEEFKNEREAVLTTLKDIPCRFPWKKLSKVLPKPHSRESVGVGWWNYHYFDITIRVRDGLVGPMTATDWKGGCAQ